jgi:hypothetical protein
MFDAMNAELRDLLDRQIAELELRIEELCGNLGDGVI